MKVKNIHFGLISHNDVDKIVVIKECTVFKKIIKIMLKDGDQEYKGVFTGKRYWLKRDVMESLEFFLDIDELTYRISKKRLKELYAKKEDEIKKVLTKKKNLIGFKS